MHAVACAFCVYSDIEREYSVSLCTHRIQNAIIHPKLLSGMVCVCVNACIPGIHIEAALKLYMYKVPTCDLE